MGMDVCIVACGDPGVHGESSGGFGCRHSVKWVEDWNLSEGALGRYTGGGVSSSLGKRPNIDFCCEDFRMCTFPARIGYSRAERPYSWGCEVQITGICYEIEYTEAFSGHRRVQRALDQSDVLLRWTVLYGIKKS